MISVISLVISVISVISFNRRTLLAPMQLLKASSDGAVTAEAGRQFQRRIIEGKKELL